VVLNTSNAEATGIPAALAFGPDRCLYITDEGRRAILRVTPNNNITEFITSFHGQRINGPNDLSFDANGNLFFTDPYTSSPRNPIGAVYGYAWETRELHRIDSSMQFPNGIVVREGRLYVAETFPATIWVYDVVGPGRAEGKRKFCVLPGVPNPPLLPEASRKILGVDSATGPDGMAFDAAGNLYVAHYGSGGISIYDSGGRLIDRLKAPGTFPTNVCFGGPAHDQLYVTVDDLGTLVVYNIGIPGDRINFCPSAVPDHPWRAMLPPVSMPR
jgi:gluconolactonase